MLNAWNTSINREGTVCPDNEKNKDHKEDMMRKIKEMYFLCISAFCILLFTSCEDEKNTLNSTSYESQEIVEQTKKNNDQNGETVHKAIEAGNIRHVNISGNAKSIIIKQSVNNHFEFYNADLNPDHTYEVDCDVDDDNIDINILMKNAEADNNILGSFVLYIPQKEFENIEVAGDFKQIHLNTIHSDAFIHANKSVVVLNVEVDQLDHNITLDGSKLNAFRDVSVYFDKLPDNIQMDLNLTKNGTVNDSKNILNNQLESDPEKPVISINNTNNINIYAED